MDYDKIRDALVLTIIILVATVMSVIISSCKQVEYVPVESIKHDSIYIKTLQVDTIIKNDSTIIQIKGDTVTTDRWHTVYKVKMNTDTLYIYHTDTVPKPFKVEVVKTEYKTPLYARILSSIGAIAILIIVLVIIIWLLKKRLFI